MRQPQLEGREACSGGNQRQGEQLDPGEISALGGSCVRMYPDSRWQCRLSHDDRTSMLGIFLWGEDEGEVGRIEG